ncbi:hypothetical protein ACB094_06G052600 [Castanea mollissima]
MQSAEQQVIFQCSVLLLLLSAHARFNSSIQVLGSSLSWSFDLTLLTHPSNLFYLPITNLTIKRRAHNFKANHPPKV